MTTLRESLINILQSQGNDGGFCLDGLYENADIIADHLLKNNVVVFPIKIGQSVWTAEPFKDSVIREGKVTTVMADENGFCGFWIDFGDIPLAAEYLDITIGTTVFLSKEEAEQHKEVTRR